MSIRGQPICGDSSLKFKFLRTWDFLPFLPMAMTEDGSKRFQAMEPLYDIEISYDKFQNVVH